MAAQTYDQIIKDLKNKVYHPIYFLFGDEPYYIDQIAEYIENNVLSDMEKEFNQTVLYGRDVDLATITGNAKRYPMMSNYQVVIVREAQDVKDLLRKSVPEMMKRILILNLILVMIKILWFNICKTTAVYLTGILL
ncbi:MAG: hypothetical protein IPG39_21175 [Bacteroidetes bacterium]|nr:hypothetical protein [Bacteroidota bacterium]